jgi:hypothetical protein
MKKYILIIGLLAVSGIVFAQLQSSVIKNTAGTEVFSVNYGSGVATMKVAVVEATTLVGEVNSSQSSVTVSGATGIVSTAAALVAPTNDISAGFRIRVNGTNYVIALYPN